MKRLEFDPKTLEMKTAAVDKPVIGRTEFRPEKLDDRDYRNNNNPFGNNLPHERGNKNVT